MASLKIKKEVLKMITIKLNTVEDIKRFLEKTSSFVSDVDIISGRYVLDAKSVIGIYTLNLSRPVQVKIHTIDPKEEARFIEEMKEFE